MINKFLQKKAEFYKALHEQNPRPKVFKIYFVTPKGIKHAVLRIDTASMRYLLVKELKSRGIIVTKLKRVRGGHLVVCLAVLLVRKVMKMFKG